MNLRDAVATFRGHHVPNFDVVGKWRRWFVLSGVLIALSLVGLLVRQLNFSIAFTGGALITFENRSGASVADYQSVMARFGREDAQVEILGGDRVQIRTESLEGLAPRTQPTPTASAAPSPAPTASASGAIGPPAPGSPGATASPSASATATGSPSATPTATGSAAATPSASGSASAGPTPTVSPSPTTLPEPSNPRAERLIAALADAAGLQADDISVPQDVGPTWGSTISSKAITALVVFLAAVTLYITFRFEWKMAVGALTALAHDLIITAGIFALVGREVTPETVIAILTILGYSLYDTVVIYDKVKENAESAALVARETYSGVVNVSLNQTLMRSVNTSLVVLFPIGSLLLFGGQTLKDFAFALFVGVASGTYSSVFIAAPILALLKEREPRYQQIRMRAVARGVRPPLRPAGPASEPAGVSTRGRALEPAATPSAPAPTGSPARSTSAAGSVGGPRPVARAGQPRKKKSKPQGRPKPRRR